MEVLAEEALSHLRVEVAADTQVERVDMEANPTLAVAVAVPM
jgi:hypothetical protein